MSKNKTTKTEAAKNNNAKGESKSQAIRDYAKENPQAGPSAIAKALVAQGVDVNASRVSTVLRSGNGSAKVDVSQIKAVSAFLKASGWDTENAKSAIEAVGGFVEAIGGKAKALAAIEAYTALAGVLG